MLPSGGVVRLSTLLEAVQGESAPQRPIRRCSISEACVTEPGRIRTTELIGNRNSSRIKFGTVNAAWYVPILPVVESRARILITYFPGNSVNPVSY